MIPISLPFFLSSVYNDVISFVLLCSTFKIFLQQNSVIFAVLGRRGSL